MGLFDKMKQKKADKKQAIADNQVALESFNVTNTLGIQDDEGCTLIFIDDAKEQFVCATVAGSDPQAFDWRSKNPWIIDFDEVEEVYVDVDEYWTEDFHWRKHEYIPRGTGMLDPSQWDDVYWCYDIDFVIKTANPYEKKINFKINDRTLCTQIPTQNKLFSTRRKGLELDGRLDASKCRSEAARLNELADEVAQINRQNKTIDFLTRQRPDGILGKFMKDQQDNYEVAQIKLAAYILEVGAEMIEGIKR